MRTPFHYFILVAIFTAACGVDERILRSGKETPAAVNSTVETKSLFEQDLAEVRSADFRFIYVIRRKDGEVMDAEDRSVIRTNTVDMNRRVAADEGRAVIIGSNYLLADNSLKALRARFDIEDLSPKDANVDK